MAICDRHGLPVAGHVASASTYEPHLVPATRGARFLTDLPTRLVGDRGYDCDALDQQLTTTYGIEMIAAHRRRASDDHTGWTVCPSYASPLEDRRAFCLAPQLPAAVTRWERHVDNFLGLLRLACARILLRHICDDF